MSDYAVNWRSQTSHVEPNRFAFGMGSDVAAEAFATAIGAALSAQETSLMLYNKRQHFGVNHAEGSDRAVKIVLIDANGQFSSVHLRNIKPTADANALGQLFVGKCKVSNGGGLVTAVAVTDKISRRGAGT